MDVLTEYHRWLRGVLALLSILVFLLSLISVSGASTIVNWTILIISQAAILVICKIYEVKAQVSGLTNLLFRNPNIFTSPFFPNMALEIMLWNIQTPPIVVFWKPFFDVLNYFIFIRLYSVIFYLNNAVYVYRTFCRVMAAMTDHPLDTSFLMRTSLIFHRCRTATVAVLGMWLTICFMYMKAEDASFADGLWFSFQSLATLGYGDMTPVTTSGQLVACLAAVGSLFFIAYAVVLSHGLIAASDAEHNIQVLARCHDLTHEVQGRSAWVIQAAWRLYRIRRACEGPDVDWKMKVKRLFLSWKLVHVIAAVRRSRRSLQRIYHAFRETTVNPLTGLSPNQYIAFVEETHQSARRLQRAKDVEHIYAALADHHSAASSLTREDIQRILQPEDGAGGVLKFLTPTHLPSPPLSPVCRAGPSTGTAEEVASLTKRVRQLEEKCKQLASLIQLLTATANTHPRSMVQSLP